jgi:hypothetical protein
MFNFRSLAEVVGVSLEGENAGRRLSLIEAERRAKESGAAQPQDSASSGEAGAAGADRAEDDAAERSRGEMPSSQQVDVATNKVNKGPGGDSKEDEQPDTAPATSASLPPPTVTITPDTPAAACIDDDSKQLGCEEAVERVQQVTQ